MFYILFFESFDFFYFIQVFDQFLAILHIGPISISEDETPPVLLNVTKIIIFQISIFSVPEITIGPFTIFNSTSSYIYKVVLQFCLLYLRATYLAVEYDNQSKFY